MATAAAGMENKRFIAQDASILLFVLGRKNKT